MKFILVVCGVILVAMLAKAFPSEAEYDEDLFEMVTFDRNGFAINEEQIQCIKDGVQKVIDDNPELKWWFDKVKESATKLVKAAKKCETLSGIEQKKCILKVKVAAKLELRRLIKLLPDDQKEVLGILKDVIKNCLE
ncbi:uncharacterized protein LOC116346196 [Contarinia nasturtii]|uniref:uncharacterized protein LOC116346196 n=1 Tax=Contarinia nasturtii TaxID=265458 RepID=UPI0012D3D1E2|nr:uncharacterized protein LOC116346196 [Contarinia nasturtii]